MYLLYISIVQLSKYKVFIGHSIHNTLLLSSWLIFKLRGHITILNLYHTIKMLKLTYSLIKQIIGKGLPLWFINFDLTKEYIIKYNALLSGEFYLTKRWIRGLISNYFVLTKAYRQYLIKKIFIDSNKVRDIYDKWLLTRFSWPRAIFISNTESAFIVSKEASSRRIANIALVDTNVKTFFYNLPIASNDDSLDTIHFMNNLISQYILQCKYKRVLVWYYFKRNIKRFHTLIGWLNNLIKLKKDFKYKVKLKQVQLINFLDYHKKAEISLDLFFGRSFNYKLLYKKNLMNNENIFFDVFYRINQKFIYHRLKAISYKNFLYKHRLKWKRFKKLKEIEGVSSFKSFLNNFIKLKGFAKVSRFRDFKRKRKVPARFKEFFHFIFFFWINKFNIIIDSYNRLNFYLKNIVRLEKVNVKGDSYWNRKLKKVKFKYTYAFRYKTKRLYRRIKRKEGYIYKPSFQVNKKRDFMSFSFFHWKYFIISLGMRIRNKVLKIDRIKPFNLLSTK